MSAARYLTANHPLADVYLLPQNAWMSAGRSNFLAGAEIALFIAFMLLVFPIVAIGVGMSGGAVLSIYGLMADLASLDAAVFLRLVAWFVLLLPPLWIWSFTRRRRRRAAADVS